MRKTAVEKFLSRTEVERINRAVAEAEGLTSGEIVPMVVGRSDAYPHLYYIGGILGLVLASALVLLITGDPAPHTWIPSLVGGFVGGYLTFGLFPSVRRYALSREKAAEEVFERALRAFHEQGLSQTRDRTGILILISLFERRVQVLADEGINTRVLQDTWDEVVKIILDGIRSRNPGDAICGAIQRCGEILSKEFPIAPDDKNELPNHLVVEP